MKKRTDFRKCKNILIVALLTIVAGACDDRNDLGISLLPTSDLIEVGNVVERNALSAFTFNDENIRTSVNSNETAKNLLGTLNDPVFGTTTIDFASQYRMVQFPDTTFFQDATADSIFLYLFYRDFYGDTITPQRLKVYELHTGIDQDVDYYHNEDISLLAGSELLADFEFTPQVSYDTTSTDSATLYQLLKIPIDISLAEKLMSADSADMLNNDVFLEYFKGLYIVPEAVSGDGSIVKLEVIPETGFNGSALLMHYHNNTDTSSTAYVIDKYSARFNSFKHDYSQTPFVGDLDQEVKQDSLIYLQPTGGLRSKVYIPGIKNWIDSTNVVINRALVKFQIDTIATEIDKYDAPQQLYLTVIGDDGTDYLPIDYGFSPAFYDGLYNPYDHVYSFNITQHFNKIIKEGVSNNGFYLSVAQKSQHANRVILKGGTSSAGIKLTVTYSKLSL